MTASVTRGRALRCAEGSARGLLHHVLGHCHAPQNHPETAMTCRSMDAAEQGYIHRI